MARLQDKVVVITGGESGIGLASARLFVSEGAAVHLIGIDGARLADAVAELGDDRALGSEADVADEEAVRRAIAAGVERFGRIDVLFSNAGISGVIRPVTDYPEDVFDAVVAVNLKGSFLACKHALPKMRDGGSIIMTSSVVGVTSDPGIAAYAASKHGLIGLMRTVAKEAAPRRIRVNVVAPGPIDNDFQRNVESGLTEALGTDAGKFLDSVIPLGRHAKAEEVAETVLFLASDKSAFTTGSVLMADGGMHV